MRYFRKNLIHFLYYIIYYDAFNLIKIDCSNIDILLKFRPFITEYHDVDGVLVRRKLIGIH